MTNYELYIDGQLCDLSTDTSVTLVYQSGLFKPLDAIQSNRSYNIDLPMTSRNIGIFKFASMPNVDSDAPYVKIKAALHKGGVPIFDNGFAVITGISDVISVTLTWGNVNNFDPLFDSPMSALSDTLYEMGIGSIPWNNNSKVMITTSDESGKGMGFYAIDYGMGLQKPQYVHPAIRVDRVLEAIEKYQRIKINGAPLRGDWEYHHVVPCLSQNGDAKSGQTEILGITDIGYIYKENRFAIAYTDQPNEHLNLISEGCKFDIEGAKFINVTFTASVRAFLGGYFIPYVADSNNLSEPLGRFEITNKRIEGRYFCYDVVGQVTLSNVSRNLPESKYISIVISPDPNVYLSNHPQLTLQAYPREKVHFPSVYPIGVNLPDMSQGEFLQSLMVLNGLFAYVDNKNPNTINLMSAYDLMRAKEEGIFVDWSNKVLLNDKRIISIPDASEFIIEDYAQKNILDYDNDDDVQANTEGTILIKNVNLEKETELTDMEFSASENIDYGDGRIAYIPIYKKQDNSGNADYNELNPRILENMVVAEDGTEYNAGYFPDMLRFGGSDGIVATKYAELQEILERLRIITVRAKLSVIDLYNLDYKKPIYISQFGRLYAIYSIETGENDICECKLVQLPTGSAYVGENLLKNTSGAKLEKGAVATDWSPNPND